MTLSPTAESEGVTNSTVGVGRRVPKLSGATPAGLLLATSM